ncbi:unnamed protein product [Laminaria digitata]
MPALRLVSVVRGTAGHARGRIASALGCHRLRRRLLSNVAAVLESRAILEISGGDAKALLQGLMTNDVTRLDEGNGGGLPCISAAFLNPKGRVLGDALVTRSPRHEAKNKPGYLLDCPLAVAEGLKRHLKLYKLRSKVKIKDATAGYEVLVSGVHDPWQGGSTRSGGEGDPSPPQVAVAAAAGLSDVEARSSSRFLDPRCNALGVRLIRPKGEAGPDGVGWPHGDAVVTEERYHALRMMNGVGEGSELVDSIPLESNLDLVGSISFTKGCYVGQELTARTQFKGFVRKRILPVIFPMEANGGSTSPVEHASDSAVAGDAEKSRGLMLASWGSGVGPPEAGSRIVDQAAGEGKLGTLVAVSPEYNVGLALLRLGKVLSPASGRTKLDNDADDAVPPEPEAGLAGGKTNPAVDCLIAGAEGSGQGGEARRCLPLLPPWWPVDLDPATGKVAA